MVEALMADISVDVSISYDFSSDEQVDQALLRLKDLSDEFILTIAQFKFDPSRRKTINKLRNKNAEGKLTQEQIHIFGTAVELELDYAIVKAIDYLEAQRRGLIEKSRLSKTKPKSDRQ